MSYSIGESFSLGKSLEQKSVSELRRLAKACSLKGYSRMKRSDLVKVVCDALINPKRLEELLYVITEPAWTVFSRAVESDMAIPVDFTESASCQLLSDLGVLFLGGTPNVPTCAVPTEIKATFRSLEANGFLQRKARYDLLHQYAEAAVNLYGIIRWDDLIALFNRQNSPPTTKEEFLSALNRHNVVDCEYCFWDEYLVDTDFGINDFADIPDLLTQIGTKPRYIPERAEFLRYANWDYFEYTAETERLKDYLIHNLGITALRAPQIISELHYACVVEARFLDMFSILTDHGVSLDEQRIGELSRLFTELCNATRLWSNNGHTPSEISELYKRRPQHPMTAQRKIAKVGRNDPCPCGSGKKYKKCCGR